MEHCGKVKIFLSKERNRTKSTENEHEIWDDCNRCHCYRKHDGLSEQCGHTTDRQSGIDQTLARFLKFKNSVVNAAQPEVTARPATKDLLRRRGEKIPTVAPVVRKKNKKSATSELTSTFRNAEMKSFEAALALLKLQSVGGRLPILPAEFRSTCGTPNVAHEVSARRHVFRVAETENDVRNIVEQVRSSRRAIKCGLYNVLVRGDICTTNVALVHLAVSNERGRVALGTHEIGRAHV